MCVGLNAQGRAMHDVFIGCKLTSHLIKLHAMSFSQHLHPAVIALIARECKGAQRTSSYTVRLFWLAVMALPMLPELFR